MMSYIVTSQNLRPKVVVQDSDTLFAFTISQSKHIAVGLNNWIYGDSINNVNIQTISYQDSIIKTMKQQSSMLRSVIDNDNAQIKNLTILSETFRLDLLKAQEDNRRLKKSRWHYFAAGIVAATVIGVVIK